MELESFILFTNSHFTNGSSVWNLWIFLLLKFSFWTTMVWSSFFVRNFYGRKYLKMIWNVAFNYAFNQSCIKKYICQDIINNSNSVCSCYSCGFIYQWNDTALKNIAVEIMYFWLFLIFKNLLWKMLFKCSIFISVVRLSVSQFDMDKSFLILYFKSF